jgi:CDGSH-type Zn-finger protein
MSEPKRAGDHPIPVDVTAGKRYWWCSCGRSQKQPFCDGSHKGSVFQPVEYVAEKNETLYFCACKGTHTAPLCDGSHAH